MEKHSSMLNCSNDEVQFFSVNWFFQRNLMTIGILCFSELMAKMYKFLWSHPYILLQSAYALCAPLPPSYISIQFTSYVFTEKRNPWNSFIFSLFQFNESKKVNIFKKLFCIISYMWVKKELQHYIQNTWQ